MGRILGGLINGPVVFEIPGIRQRCSPGRLISECHGQRGNTGCRVGREGGYRGCRRFGDRDVVRPDLAVDPTGSGHGQVNRVVPSREVGIGRILGGLINGPVVFEIPGIRQRCSPGRLISECHGKGCDSRSRVGREGGYRGCRRFGDRDVIRPDLAVDPTGSGHGQVDRVVPSREVGMGRILGGLINGPVVFEIPGIRQRSSPGRLISECHGQRGNTGCHVGREVSVRKNRCIYSEGAIDNGGIYFVAIIIPH